MSENTEKKQMAVEGFRIDAVLKGYIHKGIEGMEIDEGGNLLVYVTDGKVKNLGRVRFTEGESIFDPESDGVPSMRAVASFVEEKLFIDEEAMV